MVKRKPGSRKGKTKLTSAAYKAARKRAAQQGSSIQHRRYVLHEAMREAWDNERTASSNLSRLGLCPNINVVKKSAQSTKRAVVLEYNNGQGVWSMPVQDSEARKARTHIEQLASLPEQGTKQVLRPGENLALQRLVNKYGNNWVAMSRDIKLNYLQWTPNQLEKKIKRMQNILQESKG